MFRINRVVNRTRASILTSKEILNHEEKLPSLPSQKSSTRFFLDIHQLGNKEAIKKERERLADEMNRGYVADMSELRKHGGKIAVANKIIVPAVTAVKFPDFNVSYTDGRTLKLPFRHSVDAASTDKSPIPKATLLCLTFRSYAQAMVDSWSAPFVEAFSYSKDVSLYEVSFVDSWFLSLSPVKKMLLKMVEKSKDGGENELQRQKVYAFGDHYYFRKEAKIVNILTGYIFLLDKFGRIRWQGYGSATPEELSSLLSCTSLLLEQE